MILKTELAKLFGNNNLNSRNYNIDNNNYNLCIQCTGWGKCKDGRTCPLCIGEGLIEKKYIADLLGKN